MFVKGPQKEPINRAPSHKSLWNLKSDPNVKVNMQDELESTLIFKSNSNEDKVLIIFLINVYVPTEDKENCGRR